MPPLLPLSVFATFICLAVLVPSVLAACNTPPNLISGCSASGTYAGVTMTDVDLRDLSQQWYGDLGEQPKYAKPNGWSQQFRIAEQRYANAKMHGFGLCTDHAVAWRHEGWCQSVNDDGSIQHCVILGAQEKMDWGGAALGRYGSSDDVVAPAPTAAAGPDYGSCAITESGSDYLLENFGVLEVAFEQPTSRIFSVKIGDLDGVGDATLGGREAAAIFGLGVDGELVTATASLVGSMVAAKTASLGVTEGTALGITMAASATIPLYEASSYAGGSPGNANSEVTFTFNSQVTKIFYLFVWTHVGGTVNQLRKGYTILFDDADGSKVSCAVPCKKEYDDDQGMDTCKAGSSLFTISYESSSAFICQEEYYCDSCDDTYKMKLSDYMNPGQVVDYHGGNPAETS